MHCFAVSIVCVDNRLVSDAEEGRSSVKLETIITQRKADVVVGTHK